MKKWKQKERKKNNKSERKSNKDRIKSEMAKKEKEVVEKKDEEVEKNISVKAALSAALSQSKSWMEIPFSLNVLPQPVPHNQPIHKKMWGLNVRVCRCVCTRVARFAAKS